MSSQTKWDTQQQKLLGSIQASGQNGGFGEAGENSNFLQKVKRQQQAFWVHPKAKCTN